MTNYDELLLRLSNYGPTGSYDSERAEAWHAITKLRAERDALQLSVAGFDAAREMLNVQDNKIDALRALLKVAQDCIYSLDAREIYADELARIDGALAEDKP